MLKIKEIKAYPLLAPEPHYKGALRCINLVRIESECGLVGWGECISQMRESAKATATIIEDGFAPLLVGENAEDVERLWNVMLGHCWWYGPQGIAAFAVSAIDMALWDLAGKHFGVPVCTLLGGRVSDRVVAMGSIIFDFDDIDWSVNEFAWMKDQGYIQVKAGWGMRPDAMFGQNRKADLEMIRRIRETIGDDIELVADMAGHKGIWDPQTAIRRLNELEPYRLRWMEEPLRPRDLEGHRLLRQGVNTPIGTGEQEWTIDGYRRLIDSGGVDVVQMDPGRIHGITGALRAIRLVEAANLQVSAHTWSSALNTAASLHLLACTPHSAGMDFKPHESPLQHDMIGNPWVPEDGYLTVREEPGLGVEIKEDVVESYLF
jgi:L-alanine-DL-glutamate epimerase-like enolase superfamily enzyme